MVLISFATYNFFFAICGLNFLRVIELHLKGVFQFEEPGQNLIIIYQDHFAKEKIKINK